MKNLFEFSVGAIFLGILTFILMPIVGKDNDGLLLILLCLFFLSIVSIIGIMLLYLITKIPLLKNDIEWLKKDFSIKLMFVSLPLAIIFFILAATTSCGWCMWDVLYGILSYVFGIIFVICILTNIISRLIRYLKNK